MDRKYLSRSKGKSEDALLEFVVTNGGNYYQPLMMKVGTEFIVCVYRCSKYGHIDFNDCTYTAYWSTES